MRIKRHLSHREDTSRADIARVTYQRGVEGRVCGASCTAKCHHCGSSSCQCMCSPYCAEAPRTLSSDDAHPIEPAITPLVYAMTRQGVFEPCWSCEGHLAPDGVLWKLPTVWFYADAMEHVRLLTDALSRLRAAGRLSTPWRVVVTYSDPDNPSTTFALEPTPVPGETFVLERLQRDADEIARAMQDFMADAGRALLQEADQLMR